MLYPSNKLHVIVKFKESFYTLNVNKIEVFFINIVL